MLLKLRTADPPAKHAKPVVLPPDNLYAASLLESSTAAGAVDADIPRLRAWQPGPGTPGTVRCSSEPTALAASAPARPAAGLARAGSAAPETPVSRSVQQYERRCGSLAQAPGRSPRAAVRRSCSAGAEPGSAAPQAPTNGAAPARCEADAACNGSSACTDSPLPAPDPDGPGPVGPDGSAAAACAPHACAGATPELPASRAVRQPVLDARPANGDAPGDPGPPPAAEARAAVGGGRACDGDAAAHAAAAAQLGAMAAAAADGGDGDGGLTAAAAALAGDAALAARCRAALAGADPTALAALSSAAGSAVAADHGVRVLAGALGAQHAVLSGLAAWAHMRPSMSVHARLQARSARKVAWGPSKAAAVL